MPNGNPKDFYGGFIFTALGVLFALGAYGVKVGNWVILDGYPLGTMSEMGPGFFPFWLGVILASIGVAISLNGMGRTASGEHRLERFDIRKLVLVLGPVVGFALLLKPLGVLASGVLLVVFSSLASPNFSFRKALVLGVLLSLFCSLAFVKGLGLPIPLCPDIKMMWHVRMCQI